MVGRLLLLTQCLIILAAVFELKTNTQRSLNIVSNKVLEKNLPGMEYLKGSLVMLRPIAFLSLIRTNASF